MSQQDPIEDFFQAVKKRHPDSLNIKGYIKEKYGLEYFTKRNHIREMLSPLIGSGLIEYVPANTEYVPAPHRRRDCCYL